MIPILNLTRQYAQLQPQLEKALLLAAQSGQYILGPQVQAFEQEMADFLAPPQLGEDRTLQVISCANGSDALYLALKALDIGPGDEVITTPMTYIATSEAIVRTGAMPVFVDIDPLTYNMDVEQLEAKITPRTRALLPVHLFGMPVHMDPLLRIAQAHNLFVVEDCAQAIGAQYQWEGHDYPVGTLGDVGCFSFFPSKNLGAFGDGGMVTTRNPQLAEKIKMLRVHGSKQRYLHDLPGINSRLDELQAAILRVKLPYLNGWNQSRRDVAATYNRLLAPLGEQGLISCPLLAKYTQPLALPVFHQYTLRLNLSAVQGRLTRDELVKQLAACGVGAMVYYPVPLYRQPTHANLGLNPLDYPVCEQAAQEVLSLPMFPEITPDEQQTVVEALERCISPVLQRV